MLGAFDWLDCMILDDSINDWLALSSPYLFKQHCSVDIGEVVNNSTMGVAVGCTFYAYNSRNSGGAVMVQWNSSNEDSFQCGCPKENDGCIIYLRRDFFSVQLHHSFSPQRRWYFFFPFFYSVRTSFAKHQTSSCRLFQHEQVGFPCVQCKPPCESPFQVSNNLNKQHHLRATKLLNTTETSTSTRCLNSLSHLVLEWSSFDMDPCGLHMCLWSPWLFSVPQFCGNWESPTQVQCSLRVSGGLPNTCGARRGVSSQRVAAQRTKMLYGFTSSCDNPMNVALQNSLFKKVCHGWLVISKSGPGPSHSQDSAFGKYTRLTRLMETVPVQ